MGYLALGRHHAHKKIKASSFILLIFIFFISSTAIGSTLDATDFTDYLEDPNRIVELEDFLSSEQAKQFSPLEQAALNLGLSNTVHWFRLRPPEGKWILQVDSSLLDSVTFFHPLSDNNEDFKASYAGDTLPFSIRDVPYHTPIFELEQAGNKTFYLRVESEGTIQIPLKVWSPSDFTMAAIDDRQSAGLYLGAMLVMVFYNLFLYLAIRDRNYLYYIIYISAFILFQATISGYSQQYLWPEHSEWASKANAFFVGFVVFHAVLFSRHFLRTWEHVPYIDRLMQGVMVAGVLNMLLVFLVPYHWVAVFATLLGMGMVLVVLPAGYLALLRGYKPARFFVLAWTAFLIGIFANGLMLNGLLPHSSLTLNAMPLGSLIEVILLSLALADRINKLRQEKVQAQMSFNRELQRLNQNLEQKVNERTKALRLAKEETERTNLILARQNEQLTHLATHDMLTGLLNRRAFWEQANRLLADAKRHNHPIGVVMLDLDHFKQINDHYGHQAGDQVLAAVGKILSHHKRETDRAARYGGEEFVLFFPLSSLETSLARAEELRQSIATYRIKNFTEIKLSASFGVAANHGKVTNLDTLIAQADAGLYKAKRSGRNQVCLASFPSSSVS